VGLGRRKVALDDPSAWVFNRMADVYDARPPYPRELLDALGALGCPTRDAVVDLGAGIGHLALPLAQRGFVVHAVEPARRMLDVLAGRARTLGVDVRLLHERAEATSLADRSCGIALIADALHFIDAELTALEQLFAVSGVTTRNELSFSDETQVDHAQLDRILGSISFIGPAMNAERTTRFRERVHALSDAPVWARRFTLRWGRRES
jgi:ubiquinone/menaquinone biosynthesis C-methylase UbiE